MNWYKLAISPSSPEKLLKQFNLWIELIQANFPDAKQSDIVYARKRGYLQENAIECEIVIENKSRNVIFCSKVVSGRFVASVDFAWMKGSPFLVGKNLLPGSLQFLKLIREKYVAPLAKMGIDFAFMPDSSMQEKRKRIYDRGVIGPTKEPTGYKLEPSQTNGTYNYYTPGEQNELV